MEDTTPVTLEDSDKLAKKLQQINESSTNPYVSKKSTIRKKPKLEYKKSMTSVDHRSESKFSGDLNEGDSVISGKSTKAQRLWKQTLEATTNVNKILSLEWARLCEADGIFEDLGINDDDDIDLFEDDPAMNTSSWRVSKQNMEEFLEAIKLNERVSLTELADIIDKKTT